VVRLDLAAKEHKKPEYLRVNPNGTVPTLVDHDVPIFESAAICQHLADRAYLVDDFSVADVMVGSTLRWGGMLGLLDGSRPGLATYVERLTARPALQRATAD
jgi:glutathione S-transferase